MTELVSSSMEASVVPTDSLAAAVIQAEAATQAMRDITSLQDAASALIEAATSTGCHQLVAANAAAEPLATAAALLSAGSLMCTDKHHFTAEKVLIIDAATVTGDATRSCASYVRDNGAAWVGAVIYDRVRPDLDGLDDEPTIDFVTVLRRH